MITHILRPLVLSITHKIDDLIGEKDTQQETDNKFKAMQFLIASGHGQDALENIGWENGLPIIMVNDRDRIDTVLIRALRHGNDDALLVFASDDAARTIWVTKNRRTITNAEQAIRNIRSAVKTHSQHDEHGDWINTALIEEAIHRALHQTPEEENS